MPPPVSDFRLLTPFPKLEQGARASLSDYKGKPTVIHMYTGWGGCWPCAQQMNEWAGEIPDANFICVCVAGTGQEAVGLAKSMGQQMRLTNCVNAFIEHEELMPSWGQLGCSGFIILDSEHRLLKKKTSSFMQVRNLAFDHVEAILAAVSAGEQLPQVCPGQFCRIVGLKSRPELNGQLCICLGMDEERIQVLPLSEDGRSRQKPMSILPANARPEESDGEEEHDDGEDCAKTAEDCSGGGWQPAAGGSPSKKRKAQEQLSFAALLAETSGNDGDEAAAQSSAYVDATPIARVPSVKVASLDAEHDECVATLNRLRLTQSYRSLLLAAVTIEEHFDHEEALLREHNWGNSNSSGAGGGKSRAQFSAFNSHVEDHERILSTIRRECLGMRADGSDTVAPSFIQKIGREFSSHGEQFDNHYADHLAERGAQ